MNAPTDESPDADVRRMFRMAAGEEAALREIVEAWKTPLINYFYRSLGSREEAEELAQTTFLRLYRSASRYQPRAKFSTYLFHIARRLLLNAIRNRRRHPVTPTDPVRLRSMELSGPDSRGSEIEEVFQMALSELPENQRSALLLWKQQEMSYRQIAEVLETSESSVKTWIFRGREQLRQQMKDLL